MKKFNITFLLAGLMIISALSLSSCKKTNSSDVEEIPTTYINITDEDVNFDSRNNEFIHIALILFICAIMAISPCLLGQCAKSIITYIILLLK